MAAIELQHLTRHFGALKAVDDLSLEIHRGEVLALLGPNGAGKTTTIRMICGLLPPSGGKALVLDIDLLRAAGG